jgi:hypothetical protein
VVRGQSTEGEVHSFGLIEPRLAIRPSLIAYLPKPHKLLTYYIIVIKYTGTPLVLYSNLSQTWRQQYSLVAQGSLYVLSSSPPNERRVLTRPQGSFILSELLAHPSFSAVYAYTRRDLPNSAGSTKLQPITSTDSSQWPDQFPRDQKPRLLFSGLGTTRAQVGGLEAQRKIDYDLNLDLAKAAKEAGVETYVLISSNSANAQAYFAYPKMKGELEDSVKELGFKHTVIVRPGLIVGDRTESRPAEAGLRALARGLRSLTPKATDFWAQDAGVIAKAAVNAGVQCLEGKKEPGVWMLGMADIMSLGKA